MIHVLINILLFCLSFGYDELTFKIHALLLVRIVYHCAIVNTLVVLADDQFYGWILAGCDPRSLWVNIVNVCAMAHVSKFRKVKKRGQMSFLKYS